MAVMRILGYSNDVPSVHVVLDLATGEGAIFRHGGYAPADLRKHRVWVCPLFEPFLSWLYDQGRDRPRRATGSGALR